MAYTGPTDASLPESVRKLPKRLGAIWVNTYNAVLDESDDEAAAAKSAWSAVRKSTPKKAETGGPPPADDNAGDGQFGAAGSKKSKSIELMDLHQQVNNEFLRQYPDPDMYLIAVYDDHLIVSPAINETFKVPYTVELAKAEDKQTESVASIVFAARSQWVPVIRTFTAVKTITQDDGRIRWLTVSSGSFEDRERQIVSSDLLQSAIADADKTGDRGELWVHHVPGSAVGLCDYQAFVDGFLLESGLMYQSPFGEAAVRYLDANPETGVSIQFAYKELTRDGIYLPPGYIMERSILPADAAAFPWSGIALTEFANMTTITDEKRRSLEAILGPELAGSVIANLSVNAKALTGAGVRYKELGGGEDAPETPEPVIEPDPDAGLEDSAEAPVTEPDEETEVEAETETPTPAIEPEPEPVEYEFELSDAALDQIVERVKARLGLEGVVEKSYNPLQDQMDAMRAVLETLTADVARLGESEEARIVEKATNMPRATMRRILRPTQRKELENESEQPTPSESLADIGRRTLHGN